MNKIENNNYVAREFMLIVPLEMIHFQMVLIIINTFNWTTLHKKELTFLVQPRNIHQHRGTKCHLRCFQDELEMIVKWVLAMDKRGK